MKIASVLSVQLEEAVPVMMHRFPKHMSDYGFYILEVKWWPFNTIFDDQ